MWDQPESETLFLAVCVQNMIQFIGIAHCFVVFTHPAEHMNCSFDVSICRNNIAVQICVNKKTKKTVVWSVGNRSYLVRLIYNNIQWNKIIMLPIGHHLYNPPQFRKRHSLTWQHWPWPSSSVWQLCLKIQNSFIIFIFALDCWRAVKNIKTDWQRRCKGALYKLDVLSLVKLSQECEYCAYLMNITNAPIRK